MKQLTPENRKVVMTTDPSSMMLGSAVWQFPEVHNYSADHLKVLATVFACTRDFPLGTRIRITAEVVGPGEVQNA